jgi:hypothetical protein
MMGDVTCFRRNACFMQCTDICGFVKRLNYKDVLQKTEDIHFLSTVYFQEKPRWRTVILDNLFLFLPVRIQIHKIVIIIIN